MTVSPEGTHRHTQSLSAHINKRPSEKNGSGRRSGPQPNAEKTRTHVVDACIMYVEPLHVWKKTSNGSDAEDNDFPTSTDFQTTTNVTARPNQASLFLTCILYF